jgi:integrase/recombinase XerD
MSPFFIKELFDNFIKEKRFLDNVSENTIRSYQMSFLKFQAYASVLDKSSLNSFVIGMREEGLKPGGCNVKIRSINSFLTWCFENNHTTEHLKIKQIRTGQPGLKVFSDAHIKALVGYKPKGRYKWRTWALTCLLVDSGMRIDEALTLRLKDVDLEQLVLKIVGKGGKERHVPFSIHLRKILWQYLKKRFESEYMFSTSGGPYMYRNYIRDLKEICGELGIEGVRISPHGLRHYFAINYLRMGGDLYRLSRILGHTTVSTTQLYLRTMGMEGIREAHSQFSPLSRSMS